MAYHGSIGVTSCVRIEAEAVPSSCPRTCPFGEIWQLLLISECQVILSLRILDLLGGCRRLIWSVEPSAGGQIKLPVTLAYVSQRSEKADPALGGK